MPLHVSARYERGRSILTRAGLSILEVAPLPTTQYLVRASVTGGSVK